MKGSMRAAVTTRTQALAADVRNLPGLAVWRMVLRIILVMAGMGVLTASARLSVPFYPVPLTMQTLAVLLVGGALGPRLGAAAVASYLALGLLGAPVFHDGLGGPAVLAGPTAGYLVGFLPAAFLMGLFAHRTRVLAPGRAGAIRRWGMLACGAVLAEVAIYAVGLPWLALYSGCSLGKAITLGLVPFILGDLLKMAFAVGAIGGGRSALSRWGSAPF